MDIETGRENQPKQEKLNKPKKTNEQKRFIAMKVMVYTMCAYFIVSLPFVFNNDNYRNDLNNLENEKEKVYEEFMKSKEFTESFKQDVIKLSEDYANSKISYEEYIKKLEYLKSVANAQVVLGNSDNKLNDTIAEIDDKIEARKEKHAKSNIDNIHLGLCGTATAIITGSGIATTVCAFKDVDDDKKKKQQEKQTNKNEQSELTK